MSDGTKPIITTEEELGRALRQKRKNLVVEGTLTSRVISIRLINSTGYTVIVSVIGGAAAFLIVTFGAGMIVSMLAGAGVAAVIGRPIAKTIAEIVVSAGGVGALNDLRKYIEMNRCGDRIELVRWKS